MGEIFLAKMRGAAGFEKHVIIKTILPHLAREPEFVTKFLDEGRIVVQLTHGNIVPVFDMGEEGGEYFIAMEYIPGRDLREIIKRLQIDKKSIPAPLSLFIISEVCKGLAYAHRKVGEDGLSMGLVHRDVSPSNILISLEGDIKVIDFGIARATNKLSQTISGRIQGKFCYMSPEQASGKIVDARSDIFSVGVVLYEMLTGMRPFEGFTDLESIDLVRTCDFDPPSTLDATISPEIDEIVQRAMSRDLDERYQSIDQMQHDILGYLYTNGCAPSASDVSGLLEDLFDEGVEKREMRPNTASNKPQRLDDILDLELDRMVAGGLTPSLSIDPHTRTELSGIANKPDHTATLVTDGVELTPSEPSGEPLTPSEPILADAPAPDAAEPDLSDDDWREDVEPPREEPDEELRGGEASAPPPIADSSPVAVTPAESPEGQPRAMLIGAALLVVAVGLGAFFASRPTTGQLDIRTSPDGASILLDDAIVQGAQTPFTLEVEPGWHVVTLQKDGFEPYKTQVKVAAGRSSKIDVDALTPEVIPVEPKREITVQTKPPGALLSVDGNDLGPAPRDIEITREMGSVVVYASKPGCQNADVTLTHRYAKDHYTFSLDCVKTPDDPTPAVVENPPSKPRVVSNRPRKVKLQINATPADAKILIEGRTPSKGVHIGLFDASKSVKMRVVARGHQTVEREVTPGDIRGGVMRVTLEPLPSGCLNLRLIYPAVADRVVIGERDIGRVATKRENIELPAGRYKVRAVNTALGLDEVYRVEIKPDAAQCAHLVIFPRS